MMAERTDEHLRLFEENKEAVYFLSDRELLEEYKYCLENEVECRKVADAGRKERSVLVIAMDIWLEI
jgi:hypothetical protein